MYTARQYFPPAFYARQKKDSRRSASTAFSSSAATTLPHHCNYNMPHKHTRKGEDKATTCGSYSLLISKSNPNQTAALISHHPSSPNRSQPPNPPLPMVSSPRISTPNAPTRNLSARMTRTIPPKPFSA